MSTFTDTQNIGSYTVRPQSKITPFAEVKTNRTPQSFVLPEYTDDQFHADLKKASGQLKVMSDKAKKDYREGKTRKLP